MNKKLFVGRLPFAFSNDQLRALFIKSGTVVSAVMVPDAKSGKTRGFGFVDMSTEAEAQAAIQALNGTPLEDKKIWVTLAREKGEAKPQVAAPFPKRRSPGNDRRPFGDSAPTGSGNSRRPFGDRSAPGDRRPFTDRSPSNGRRPFGDRPAAGDRRPFTDRSGPPRLFGPPSTGPKKFSPSQPANGRRPSGDHFTDNKKPFSDARSSAPSSFPKKEFRSRDSFRGPPKRAGGRRPPPR